MSRISEVLRRASEQYASQADAASIPAAIDGGQELAALSHEPFPVEMGEWRRAHSHAAADDRTTETPAAPVAPIEPAEPRRTLSGPGKTLFERIDARLKEKVVADGNMAPMWREQYRRLAAMLHDAQGNTGLRVVMVASAAPAEGKTLTAANLALTLGDSYLRRVLLIDADFRKPTLHQMFRVNTTSGLIDGLEAQGDVRVVLRQVSSQLWVLPAGRPTSDPMAGLTSERMRRLVQEAKDAFDWVIIDTPPLLLLPDAHLLSTIVDSAVLVVRANSTPHDLVKRAVDIIGRSRITGVVLNRADARSQPAYGQYDPYTQYEPPVSADLVR